MRAESRRIDSVSDLLKYLQEDIANYKGQVWFRGHSRSTWKLQPSLLRKKRNVTEATLFSRFKQNASLLVPSLAPHSFEWLFQMQHYGIPTRLLDWTESPLAAIYFAVCNDAYVGRDGTVWMLLPTELNKHAKVGSDEEFYIPSFESDDLKSYDPAFINKENTTRLLPLAAIATRNSPRMQAQLGVFTINHKINTHIDKIGDSSHIWSYKIPRGRKLAIRRELELLSITRFHLFPELENIKDMIKRDLE